jgi:hypothetical protein
MVSMSQVSQGKNNSKDNGAQKKKALILSLPESRLRKRVDINHQTTAIKDKKARIKFKHSLIILQH